MPLGVDDDSLHLGSIRMAHKLLFSLRGGDFMMDDFNVELAAVPLADAAAVANAGAGGEGIIPGQGAGEVAWGGSFEGEDEDFGFGVSASAAAGRGHNSGNHAGGARGGKQQQQQQGGVLDLLTVEHAGVCEQWSVDRTEMVMCP